MTWGSNSIGHSTGVVGGGRYDGNCLHSGGLGGVEYAVVRAVWNIIRRCSIMLACRVMKHNNSTWCLLGHQGDFHTYIEISFPLLNDKHYPKLQYMVCSGL